MIRRLFARDLAGADAAGAALPAEAAQDARKRRMTIDLVPGAIGVSANPSEVIVLAHSHGFESVQPNGQFLSGLEPDRLRGLTEDLRGKGLRWGAAGLPVDFRRDDDTFRQGLGGLATVARGLAQAGATRVGTWISPGHDRLTYRQNFALHVERLGAIARVLHDHGLRLGLEYVGTPSARARRKFPFVHCLVEARELIAEVGVPGVGLVLDSWHWWMARDTVEDLKSLRNEDIVAVDLNDAPAGIPPEQQQDNQRELPLATGVIPVREFLSVLRDLDYDGPVRAEPFNAPLNQLDNDAACAQVAESLRRAMALLDG